MLDPSLEPLDASIAGQAANLLRIVGTRETGRKRLMSVTPTTPHVAISFEVLGRVFTVLERDNETLGCTLIALTDDWRLEIRGWTVDGVTFVAEAKARNRAALERDMMLLKMVEDA